MSSNSPHVECPRAEGHSPAVAQLSLSRRGSKVEFYRPCDDFNMVCKSSAITMLNNTALNGTILKAGKIKENMNAQMRRLYHAAELLKCKTGQSEVGRLLNQSPQVLANWESRGMSAAGVLDAAAVIGCDAIWLRDGTGKMQAGEIISGLPVQDAVQLLLLYDKADPVGKEQIMDAAAVASKVVLERDRQAGND